MSGLDSVGLFLCIKHRHKSGMIYGYARVSTDGQSVEAQVRQLARAGMLEGVPRGGERRQDRPERVNDFDTTGSGI